MERAIDRHISDNLGKLKTDVNNLVKERMIKLARRLKRILKALKQNYVEKDKYDALEIKNRASQFGIQLHISEKKKQEKELEVERKKLALVRETLRKYTIKVIKAEKEEVKLIKAKKEKEFAKKLALQNMQENTDLKLENDSIYALMEDLEAQLAEAQEKIDSFQAAIAVATKELQRRSQLQLRKLRF